MSTPAVVLELIGQAVLPALGEPSGSIAVDRLARDVWAAWARERDFAGRTEDLQSLIAAPAADLPALVAAAVRRLLPGRAGPGHAALTRYLAVLPPLLRQTGGCLSQADDLLRWLPPRLPRFQAGDRPACVGDRELLALLRITPAAECWLARNPRFPALPAVLLAFFADRAGAERALAWREQLLAGGEAAGLLDVQHSFLEAESPCLQLAAPPGEMLTETVREPSRQHGRLFRCLVEIVAGLHRRRPAVTLGRLEAADVFVQRVADEERPVLTVLAGEPVDPRQDVFALGRIGQQLLGTEEEALASLLAECVAADPLQRPADAAALLDRLGPLLPAPVVVAAPAVVTRPAEELDGRTRWRSRRGSEVWKVLDSLQKAEPELSKLLTNSAGMKLALVPAGTFAMGSPPGEVGRATTRGRSTRWF